MAARHFYELSGAARMLIGLIFLLAILAGCDQSTPVSKSDPTAAETTIHVADPEAEEHFGRGQELEEQNDLEAALHAYSTAIDVDPSFPSPYVARARVELNLGNTTAALNDANHAVQLDSSNAEAYLTRGIVYAVQGDTQSAIQDYDRSIVLEPDNWLAYGNRGVSYRDQGNLNAAISDFDRAIELAPETGSLYLRRGSVYADQGKWSAAVKDYTSSIELLSDDSERATALYNRGNAYSAQGNSNAAIEDYGAVIALRPNDAEALNNRAVLYRRDKQYAAALADLKQALELDPEDDTTRFNIQFNLGLTNYDLNDYEAAAEAFRSAAEISPGSADALAYYGNVKLQQKDFQTALEFCNRALEIDPRNTVARLCRTAADLQLPGSD